MALIKVRSLYSSPQYLKVELSTIIAWSPLATKFLPAKLLDNVCPLVHRPLPTTTKVQAAQMTPFPTGGARRLDRQCIWKL